MGEYMIWVWLIVFIFMLVLEFITTDFVSVWFAISAIPTIIITLIFKELIWLQITTFFVVGFLLMLLIRKYVVRYTKKNIVSTNVDSYIGKNAIVTETIRPDLKGLVSFENDTWTAISNEEIDKGDMVKIIAIEGNKFIVTKI